VLGKISTYIAAMSNQIQIKLNKKKNVIGIYKLHKARCNMVHQIKSKRNFVMYTIHNLLNINPLREVHADVEP